MCRGHCGWSGQTHVECHFRNDRFRRSWTTINSVYNKWRDNKKKHHPQITSHHESRRMHRRSTDFLGKYPTCDSVHTHTSCATIYSAMGRNSNVTMKISRKHQYWLSSRRLFRFSTELNRTTSCWSVGAWCSSRDKTQAIPYSPRRRVCNKWITRERQKKMTVRRRVCRCVCLVLY